MKKILSIIIIISSFAMLGNLNAQSIKTYKLQMPSIILNNGGPIYVGYLDNSIPVANELQFKTEFRDAMIKGINAENIVVEQGLPTLNPWMTTKIYETTENKEEANYIIEGEYEYETSLNRGHKAHKISEISGDSLPVFFYEYTASSNAKLIGKVFIKDNKADKIIKEYTFSKTKEDSKSQYMDKPNVQSPAEFFSGLNNAVIVDYRYMLNPIKREFKYDFPRLSPDSKDYRKDFKEGRSKLRNLAKDDNVKEIAKVLFALQKIEDNEDVNLSLGMCYEMIGNYTKAKEYYSKSGDSDATARITEQIQIRDQLKELGVEINEPEF
jgi:tetratricopeptide (TPR) repeat protein